MKATEKVAGAQEEQVEAAGPRARGAHAHRAGIAPPAVGSRLPGRDVQQVEEKKEEEQEEEESEVCVYVNGDNCGL